jgi:molybdopterin converting factor small subunit
VNITVQFFSYFKELAGCESFTTNVPPGATIADIMDIIYIQFPKLEPMRKSTLIAVGLDYQDRSCVLNPGDEVSLFPPVQGG